MKHGLVSAVALAGLASVHAAKADPFWFDPPLATPITQGQWFFGVGAIGAYHRPPRWKSTTDNFSSSGASLGQDSFTASSFVVGPGGMLGYTFRDGTLPRWIGTNARVALSGSWMSGHGTSNATKSLAPGDFLSITAVDGRVGTNDSVVVSLQQLRTLRTSFNAYELGLRLTADHPIAPNATLIPSVGIFGGHSRDRYDSNYFYVLNTTGVALGPGFVKESVNATRIGADLGLGVSWRAASYLSFGIGGRAGFNWIRGDLSAADCFLSVAGTLCNVSPGTFAVRDAFATSASNSRSTVGFRGSVGASMTLDGGWIQAQLGGFFNFDSATPTVANPAAGVASTALEGTSVGPARIRFASGYTAGGFLSVRVALP